MTNKELIKTLKKVVDDQDDWCKSLLNEDIEFDQMDFIAKIYTLNERLKKILKKNKIKR